MSKPKTNLGCLTLGSLFDGIGGWLVAATKSGVKPLWSSEIDEYPAAVTKYHFPDVKQYGDITQIDGKKIEPVDILCAGSPCQDLSVAGKRAGLEGNRSSLFHEAIRIMREMRKKTNGEYPKYFVWENVPGAFSSNRGQDFRAVLEEVTEGKIPMPKSEKWAESGMVRSSKCTVEWRVLDAQYWGVPQRRKRIFLVADFTGRCAREILFERESLSGHPAESQGERKGSPRNAETSPDCAVVRMRAGCPGGGKGALVSMEKSLTLATGNDQTLFTGIKDKMITCYNMGQPSNDFEPYTEGGGVSPTLISRMGTGGNQVPIVHCLNDQGGKVMSVSKNKTATLRAENHGHPPIVHSYALQGSMIGRKLENGPQGDGINEEVSFTLNTIDRHAVAYCMGHDERSATFVPNKTDPLTASDYKQPPVVSYQKTVGALCFDDYKGINNQYVGQDKCVIHNQVRKLTPTECERLQGLPDGYTDIEFNGKPAPDSRRYKALGNGMAQPCADFVIRQICLSAH